MHRWIVYHELAQPFFSEFPKSEETLNIRVSCKLLGWPVATCKNIRFAPKTACLLTVYFLFTREIVHSTLWISTQNFYMCSIYDANHLRQYSLSKIWKFLDFKGCFITICRKLYALSSFFKYSQKSYTIFAADVSPIPVLLIYLFSYLWLASKVLLQLFSRGIAF